METIKELMERTGLHYGVIRYRIKRLGLESKYTNIKNQAPVRIFTPDEIAKIEGYKPGKPGRPWKKAIK